eukprot:gnl/TRDRNA2_/TRDRNA2_172074_c0_seq1.p1 gnl/TRDRNA2_/TRDRNA2_172074_c0~~gnl/TRDRNA2_/TRDRNA2_172074_c0_seq1.p1  ORF type:complete len:366 (-),score=58.87 gnl/TRDRNA2_/TRDRNA2_172074_c0_seq1:79-1107(-)
MAEDEDDYLKNALEKKGMELFKEILRIYELAEVESYYGAGVWADEVMRMDLEILTAHRKEANAPEPPPLEEVSTPALPQQQGWGRAGGIAGVARTSPVGQTASSYPAASPASGPRSSPPMGVSSSAVSYGAARGTTPVTTHGPASGYGSQAYGAASGGAKPVDEMRLLALFVAKWKVDSAKTKMMLAKLTPARRRYVIQNFKTSSPGAEATDALEEYLDECEATNAWPSASEPAAVKATPSITGVKRPAPSQAPAIPSPEVYKRPRIGSPAAPTGYGVAGKGSYPPARTGAYGKGGGYGDYGDVYDDGYGAAPAPSGYRLTGPGMAAYGPSGTGAYQRPRSW